MRISLIGDSSAEGLKAPLEAQLAEKGHALVDIRDRRGFSVARLVTDGAFLRLSNPEFVIVAAGGNDLYNDEQAREAVSRALSQLSPYISGGVPVLWAVAPVTTREDVERARARTGRLVQELGQGKVHVLYSDEIVTRSYLSSDGVHLRRDGFAKWAQIITEAVERVKQPLVAKVLRALLPYMG